MIEHMKKGDVFLFTSRSLECSKSQYFPKFLREALGHKECLTLAAFGNFKG